MNYLARRAGEELLRPGSAYGADPLGTLEVMDGRPVLRFERRLAHQPEKVWRALTEPGELAHWFPATVTTQPRSGGILRFSFDADTPDGDYANGKVLELDPPKVFAFSWAGSVLRFELVPETDGCLLLFSHTLSGTGTEGDLPSVARQAPGWDACLGLLVATLDGEPAEPGGSDWFLARAEAYVESYGLGEGEALVDGDGWMLRFERDLVQPREQVWAVLTEGDAPVVGGQAPVRFTHGYLEPAAVTELQEGRTVEYGWRHGNHDAGTVRLVLRDQQPLGTRLVLTQTVPQALAEQRATQLAAWQTHLELLFAALHGDVRCPWPRERTELLRQRYEDRLRGRR
ncbi:hypothetical protein SacmaDRAFT_3503 [Saccharomonospora marina XMU15]|uniref:Activator of Hsp90 ATPase homologue 1/2-like C-terminal domain-containing protein n=1 Tax=Saccharomonospora marina XMU15 TaxID=882083 RepID=H5WXR0_9PSEU|nr:SRPBCC family protein [Saccharomonospora marina]EHR51719.1 hypothetical protein SacmaDRAFT_3503 [Saccharomonospora marina XMU15]